MSETQSMERIVVSGAALKDKLARISLRKVPDKPGIAASIFHTMAKNDIVVDDIIQTEENSGTANVSFTVDHADLNEAKAVCDKFAKKHKCEALCNDDIAKVSVVGVGMRVHTGVAEIMFEALAKAKINIQNITTSEIKISCLIDRKQGEKALRVVHDAFKLGGKGKKAAKKKTAKKAVKKTAKKAVKKKVAKKTTKKAAKKK